MDPSDFIPLSARGVTSVGESSQLRPKRKWRQSSSSGSYDGPLWMIEKSRIGFPQPLPKLPVQIMPIAADDQRLTTWKSCQEEAEAIVSEESLDWGEIGVYLRKGVGEIRPSPTLLISLKSDLDQGLAKSALVTIGHMLHEKGVKDLRVEIADPKAYLEETIFPINENHPLIKLWPRKIKRLVLDILEYVTFSELGVYEYGYSPQTAVPTITITVKDETHSVREELKSAIVQVCTSNGAPGMRVAVVFDEAKMGNSTDVDEDGYLAGSQSYARWPSMGHSIGVGSSDAGTLGGYIILVDRQTNIRRPAFLTCWHLLRPGDGTNLLPGQLYPITYLASFADSLKCSTQETRPMVNGLSWAPMLVMSILQLDEISIMRMPSFEPLSTRRTNYLNHLVRKEEADSLSVPGQETLLAKRRQKEIKKTQLQINLNLHQNKEEVFGHSKIASGYRTANGHTLDWAIGEPLSERTGANDLPTQVDLRKVGGDGFDLLGKTRVRGFDISTQYQGREFFKTGSRTGLTVGYYNAIEATVIITLPGGAVRITSEHIIVGRPTARGRFNERGDSGSWILSETGNVVGLLWGGTHRVCYFTPIQMVLADVEARTGMMVELPP